MIQNNCKIIGVTGGIATGKSTFTGALIDMGYRVIDADLIARDLMKKGNKSYEKTIEHFGEGILKDDGQIDRKVLGQIVFSNPKELKFLNGITHPFIFEEIKNQIGKSFESLIFLDIPLLFEEYHIMTSYGICFDEIWLVYADRNTQIKRVMKRDYLTRTEAIKRVDSQMSIDLKKEKADRVIYNLESIDELKEKIELLLKDLS